MLSVYIKTSCKERFLNIEVNNNESHQKNTMCTFFYTQKAKQTSKIIYIYIQKARHFLKIKTICVTFLFTKSLTLYATRFSWMFWNCHLYIYKSTTLCVTWRFNIQKSRRFEKIKTICVTLFYTKRMTLCVIQFFM